jgi:uncharacterized circularly permuted ATP-grasp superfamily protein
MQQQNNKHTPKKFKLQTFIPKTSSRQTQVHNYFENCELFYLQSKTKLQHYLQRIAQLLLKPTVSKCALGLAPNLN